jgi:hypothetical protein
MHEIIANGQKILLTHELIDDDQEIVLVSVYDVNGDGLNTLNTVFTLSHTQAWELADFLVSGQLTHMIDEIAKVNDNACDTQVWHPHHKAFVKCGDDGVHCPTCEYHMAREYNYEGYP